MPTLKSTSSVERNPLGGGVPSPESPKIATFSGRTYKTVKLTAGERFAALLKIMGVGFAGTILLGMLFISSVIRQSLKTWARELKTGKRKIVVLEKQTQPVSSQKTEKAGNVIRLANGVSVLPKAYEAPILRKTQATLPATQPTVTPQVNAKQTDITPAYVTPANVQVQTPVKQAVLSPGLAAAQALGSLTAKNFSQHAQLVINNFYKKPLPPHDEVKVPNLAGDMVVWKDLSKEEQLAILKANKKGSNTHLFLNYEGPAHCQAIVPRWSHGSMHVSRAAVEINLIVQMRKKYDPSFNLTEEDVLIAQYLAIFHDSARQAEGVDVWDDLSAENARSYLTAMGYDQNKVNRAIEDLKSKDNSDPASRSPIAKLVHDADCLDIMRVYGKSSFKNQYLDMFNDLKDKSGFLKDLEDLKKDLYAFIQFTEQPFLKTHLETQSQNYFQEVLGLVGYKQHGQARFPFISDLLKKQIGELPKVSHQVKFAAAPEGQWATNPDYTPGSGQIAVVKNLLSAGKAGVNQSYIVADETGKLFFWKVGDKFTLPSETGASQLTSYITGGLVPVAISQSFQPQGSPGALQGSMQPYVEMKKGAFSPKETKTEFDPAKLSDKQREQFFAHMIADRVIANYDTHTGQFRIDAQGNVVGFDKGQAYKFFGDRAKKFFGKEEPKTFDPSFYWQPIAPNKPTYTAFATYLKQNPVEVERIWNSDTVKDTFDRCKHLSAQQIEQSLKGYAQVAFAGKEKEFIQAVHQRAHNIEQEVKAYFLLP